MKSRLLDRRAGYNQAVVFIVPNVGEGFVEGLQMLRRGVLRAVGDGVQQRDVHLQRRVGKQPEKLGFGHDFRGHQIEYAYFQRPYVLRDGAILVHNEDVFALQNLFGRQ